MIEYMDIPALVPVGCGSPCHDSRLAIENAMGYGGEKDFAIHLSFMPDCNGRFRLDMV